VRALVQGQWEDDGRLTDAHGRDVVYTGTDGLISGRYRGVPARSFVAALRAAPGLSYDAGHVRGVVPHLWTALEPHGKIGATFIGRCAAECDDLQNQFVTLLDRLAAGPS